MFLIHVTILEFDRGKSGHFLAINIVLRCCLESNWRAGTWPLMFFGFFCTFEHVATVAVHRVEFCLSVNLQNGSADQKMSPELTSLVNYPFKLSETASRPSSRAAAGGAESPSQAPLTQGQAEEQEGLLGLNPRGLVL